MIATTKRMWMNPLIVYDVIIPSNHIASSMTAIAQSMVTFLSIVLHRPSHTAARSRVNRADTVASPTSYRLS
jgi:hypothetical protein